MYNNDRDTTVTLSQWEYDRIRAYIADEKADVPGLTAEDVLGRIDLLDALDQKLQDFHYRPHLPLSVDFRYELGKSYPTVGGKIVTVIAVKDDASHKGYETVQCDDREDPEGGHRYNRASDRGRCTGSPYGEPTNLLPIVIDLKAVRQQVVDDIAAQVVHLQCSLSTMEKVKAGLVACIFRMNMEKSHGPV